MDGESPKGETRRRSFAQKKGEKPTVSFSDLIHEPIEADQDLNEDDGDGEPDLPKRTPSQNQLDRRPKRKKTAYSLAEEQSVHFATFVRVFMRGFAKDVDPAIIWRVIVPYWLVRDRQWKRTLLFVHCATMLLCINVKIQRNGISGQISNAMIKRDEDLSRSLLWAILQGVVLEIFFSTVGRYCETILKTNWREWMTRTLLLKYCENRKYYEIVTQTSVDNPGSRIHDDVALCTDAALNIFRAFFEAALDLFINARQLLAIHPPMLLAIVIYAAIGNFISVVMGSELMKITGKYQHGVADFNFSLVRLRVNAESVAFYGGEEIETNILLTRFLAVVKALRESIPWKTALNTFTGIYFALVAILPHYVGLPAYFRHEIDLGFLLMSSGTCSSICGDVSVLMSQMEPLASFWASAKRLAELFDTLRTKRSESETRIETSRFDDPKGPLLKVEMLTITTPNTSRKLFENLNVNLSQGESLLVMGSSGCGKTSFLRILAGLWTSGTGALRKNTAAANAFFLPQKPYLVLGSLRDQMLYPTWTRKHTHLARATSRSELNGGAAEPEPGAEEESFSPGPGPEPADEELTSLLEAVGLGHLLRMAQGGLDQVKAEEWEMLSLGEQQRLALTRLALTKPKLALLDECTSALDEDLEAKAYQFLLDQDFSFISIGHRSTLRKFHSKELRLSRAEGAKTDEPCNYEIIDTRAGMSPKTPKA